MDEKLQKAMNIAVETGMLPGVALDTDVLRNWSTMASILAECCGCADLQAQLAQRDAIITALADDARELRASLQGVTADRDALRNERDHLAVALAQSNGALHAARGILAQWLALESPGAAMTSAPATLRKLARLLGVSDAE